MQNNPTPTSSVAEAPRGFSAPTPLPKRPEAPVRQLAAECVLKHGEHTDDAAAELLAVLRGQFREFYDWMAERAMRQWCFEQVRHGRALLRRQIIGTPAGRQTQALQPLGADSLAALATWYDWPLTSGMKLGDATASEIEESAAKYERDAVSYMSRAEFLRKVQQRLPSADARVREVLSDGQIAELAVESGVISGDAS